VQVDGHVGEARLARQGQRFTAGVGDLRGEAAARESARQGLCKDVVVVEDQERGGLLHGVLRAAAVKRSAQSK
jgi:hypothetical protein